MTKPGDAPTLTDAEIDTKIANLYRTALSQKPGNISHIEGKELWRLIYRAAYAAGAASRCPPREPCPRCKGTGRIEVTSFSDPGKLIENSCRVCKGSGEIDAAQEDKPL